MQAAETFRGIGLFAGMSDDDREALVARCRFRNYEPGEMIVDANEASNDLRIVLAGEVRVVVRMIEGREVIFNDFGQGQFFGEIAAIDGGVRSANVSARSRCRIAIVPRPVLRELCDRQPTVAWALMEHLATLVRHLSVRLSEFSFLKAKHRLCAELMRQSRPRAGHEDQRIISPVPRQVDIADRIASRREIVSREMKALERAGILLRERGGLVIVAPHRLEALIEEGWTGRGDG